MTQSQTIDKMSFEAALEELQALVATLESASVPLDQSIAAYERGVALKNHCESKLREAQEKIEKITMSKDGALSVEPFERLSDTP